MKLILFAAALAASQPADRIFIGAHIVTMDASRPSAVAVVGERILWSGDATAAEPWIGANTTVTQLGHHALLPGFIDAHGHLSFLAQAVDMANVSSPPVGPARTIADVQRVLREYIASRDIPQGAWVIGMGYDDSLLEEQRHPERTDLDAVTTDHAVVLLHVSGHLMTANSIALARAGIGAETPDPAGGHIRREAGSNQPNGVLEETATLPLRSILQAQAQDPLDTIPRALDVYARYGITTVQDGATSIEQLAKYEALDAQGRLDLDVVAYPLAMAPDVALPDRTRFDHYGQRLKIGGVKLLLDGSPQGKTAYLSEPYFVPPPGAEPTYRGYPMADAATIDALVARYTRLAMQIIAHANGDAAAEMLIDAVERAAPAANHRTVMIHAQTVRDDQLDRMARLGIMPSYFSAHTFYWGDWHRDSVLGPTRAAHISPMRSTVDRGMHFTVHNDAPVVPPDMIRLLWASTNRITRSGKVLGADQRLTTLEALKAMTSDAAYQYFEENQKGSITVGKLADFVVLDADPLAMATEDLLDLSIIETISHGRTVYRKEQQ